MNGNDKISMSYGSMLSTIVLLGSLAGVYFTAVQATDAVAADLDKHIAVDEVHDQYVKDKLKNIEKLLEQIAED